jgi:GDP-L-fucose synthase
MINLCDKCIVVTGGAGFLGTAVVKALVGRGVSRHQIYIPRSSEYNLVNEQDVIRMYDDFEPQVVIHLAAEVGGIGANMAQPGRFFYSNMAMGIHLVEHARLRHLEKFIHTGTVCAYPKYCTVPFQEHDIWNGYPEETNAPYGVAKKAIFVMLDGYQRQYGLKSSVVVPVNLYGPNDNFNPASSHVIPALIKKCLDAKRKGKKDITCWGTGSATRQFLFVEDAAEAIVRAAEHIDTPQPINIGGGEEIVIQELVQIIAETCEFKGNIIWDATKPDGQPRRAISITRANDLLDWWPQEEFKSGLLKTVRWYFKHSESLLPHDEQTAGSDVKIAA